MLFISFFCDAFCICKWKKTGSLELRKGGGFLTQCGLPPPIQEGGPDVLRGLLPVGATPPRPALAPSEAGCAFDGHPRAHLVSPPSFFSPSQPLYTLPILTFPGRQEGLGLAGLAAKGHVCPSSSPIGGSLLHSARQALLHRSPSFARNSGGRQQRNWESPPPPTCFTFV